MRAWTRCIQVASLGALAALGACGGGDDVDCSFEECGGDITGEWTLAELCNPNPVEIEDCPEATFDDSDIRVDGEIVFLDDGSYARTIRTQGVLTGVVPQTCLPDAITCENLNFGELSCVTADSGDDCECELDLTDTEAEDGTWTTSGSDITLDPEPVLEPAYTGQYCVRSGVLKYQAPPEPGDEPITIVFEE